MIQSILSNMAIILLGHLLMSTLMNYRDRFSEKLVFICIVILFSGVIITLFYLPIQFGEYRLDLRLIPLVLLAMLRGWKITLPVLITVSAWRYVMGGDGAVPGIIFGMCIPTLLVLAICRSVCVYKRYIVKILLVTACWFISDFPIIFLIPNGVEIFKSIFLIRYTSFLGVAFIYYAFIQLEYRREDLKRQLEFLAWHDQLTTLPNKSRFMHTVEEKIRNKATNHYIAMLDLDHFKQLNDTYGHLAGDNILRQISFIFKKYMNEYVQIARFGGEEFIMYQEASSLGQAVNILEQLQKEIRSTSFKIDSELSTMVTISIGLAELAVSSSLAEAIKQADQHLYIAKEKGRDRLVSATFT